MTYDLSKRAKQAAAELDYQYRGEVTDAPEIYSEWLLEMGAESLQIANRAQSHAYEGILFPSLR